MLAGLDQITSILSNVCVILIIAWLVIKSWQFKKYISYYIKMTQPEDQIDQLLLQAVASNSVDIQAGDAQLDDNAQTKMKEKLIQVVAGGKSRRYLGKLMTMKEIEQLDDEAFSRAAKAIHCAQNVKTVRLCTEFNKSINNIFLICHILLHFQDGRH